jgi:hypothetical protein
MATRKRKRTCTGTTKKGAPCKAAPLKGQRTCLAHADEKTRDFTGFGGTQPGAGRPRLPRVHERMAAWMDEHLEEVFAPYREAIAGAVVHGFYQGEFVLTDHPDLAARIAAAEKLQDRIYGKPRQALEVSGGGGGPVEQEVVLDDASRELIGELLRRRARTRP